MTGPAVTVVGAGVVGLTVARTLEESGFDVRVVAEARGVDASSGAAGAVWFLYGAEYEGAAAQRANASARATWAWLAGLARSVPQAGVRLVDAWQAASNADEPGCSASMPACAGLAFHALDDVPQELRREVGGELPAGAWHFLAPVVHPPTHLAWLESGLARPIETRRVERLADEPGDAVVHCTGHGAEDLVDDALLDPRLGRTAIATAGALPRDRVLMDDREPDAMLYAIPRADGGDVVLGGEDVPRSSGATLASSPAALERILARHRACGIAPDAPVVERVGWRPGRRGGPRLERDVDAGDDTGRIVHCYGHGGAGFTLARGEALEVARIVRGMVARGADG